jgi:hypothetical protein
MSEKQTSTIEWLYGLEDYFDFSNNKEAADYIRNIVTIFYADNPNAALKKLCVNAFESTDDLDQFSKIINLYFTALDKNFTLLELASNARILFNKEKIFNAIHMYSRQNTDSEILNDALSRSQIKSKIWLIDELENVRQRLNDPVYKQVVVMAGWFGQLKSIYDKKLTYRKMRVVELDKQACEVSDYIFNLSELENYKVKAVNANINNLTLHKNGYEWDVENFREGTKYSEKFLPDLIINTSAEHMTEEWYNQIRFKNLDSNPIVAIQSNNLFDIPEHINCVHSVDHMKKKFPMKEILFEGELQLKGYKRVMLIGRP